MTKLVFLSYELTLSAIVPFLISFMLSTYPLCSLMLYLELFESFTMPIFLIPNCSIVFSNVLTNFLSKLFYWCHICYLNSFLVLLFKLYSFEFLLIDLSTIFSILVLFNPIQLLSSHSFSFSFLSISTQSHPFYQQVLSIEFSILYVAQLTYFF